MIRNKWIRDIIEDERELEFYKAHYLASAIIMTFTGKSETVLEMHKKVASLCFPWETAEKKESNAKEDAVRRYQEMQKSGTIDDMKRDVSVNEVFTKWRDPLLDEESK